MKFKAMAAMALGLTLVGGALKAEDKKPAAWYEKINAAGYVDAYYQYNLNGRSAPSAPGNRAFDVTQQQFTFSGAKLALSESDAASKTGGELDLFYGPTTKLFNTSSPTESLAVEQAFITDAFGPVTFKLGKFTTFVGTEVIETPANLNYSRGTLFGAIPFYHVGLEATYVPMDGTSIMAYTGNGNSVDAASSERRDWGLTLGYTGVKGLGLTAIYYMESGLTPTTVVGQMVSENTHYFDFLASYQIAETLAFNGEYLYKTRIAAGDTDTAGNLLTTNTQVDPATGKKVAYSPKQQGYALYLNYTTPIANLSVIPRFEQFYTPEGSAPSLGALTTDTTITLKYAQGPLTHYLEYRNDWKSDGAFAQAAGVMTDGTYATTSSSQNTVTYGATYSF